MIKNEKLAAICDKFIEVLDVTILKLKYNFARLLLLFVLLDKHLDIFSQNSDILKILMIISTLDLFLATQLFN